MKALAVFAFAVATVSVARAEADAPVQLQAGKQSLLHVGQTATLRVPSRGHFSVGSAEDALVLTEHKRQRGDAVYIYRAARVGNHTFVATPRDPGPDGCISCVTVHDFVKVIQ
jgi:hypothetical protein